MAKLQATKCPQCHSKFNEENIEEIKENERVIAREFHCENCNSDWKYELETRRMRRL